VYILVNDYTEIWQLDRWPTFSNIWRKSTIISIAELSVERLCLWVVGINALTHGCPTSPDKRPKPSLLAGSRATRVKITISGIPNRLRSFLFLPQRGFTVDVSLISLCHAYFLAFLQQELSLDVKFVSLCYNMPLCKQNRSGGVITGKIRHLNYCVIFTDYT
jgi:hypothetical protein